MSNSLDFWDSCGLLHQFPNYISENGILFTAEYYMAEYLNRDIWRGQVPMGPARATIQERHKWYSPNPIKKYDYHPHFSNDNMTGLYSLMYLRGSKVVDALPVVYWNNSKRKNANKNWLYKLIHKTPIKNLWLHPRDFIYYNILKERKWSYLLLPLLLFMSYYSCKAPKNITSGKCKWWLMLNVLSLHSSKLVSWCAKKMFKFNTKVLITSQQHVNPWVDVFRIYFTNPDMPVRKSIEDLYEN